MVSRIWKIRRKPKYKIYLTNDALWNNEQVKVLHIDTKKTSVTMELNDNQAATFEMFLGIVS